MTRQDADLARAALGRAQPLSEMRRRGASSLRTLLIAAVAVGGAAALAGCEEQSYPTPTPDQAEPPPPPPAAAPLMGAPVETPPPYAPCATTPCGPAQPYAAPHVIASKPVPNPVEPDHPRHHRHKPFWAYGEAQPAPSHHAQHRHGQDGWHVVGSAGATKPAPATHGAATAPTHAAASTAAPAAPQKPAASGTAPAVGAANTGSDSAAGGSSTAETDRYTSLQTALSNLVGIDAVLATPDRFQANQTVDVTLTLPANFAQQVHDEASKAGLSDAAQSVNLDARLTGTGYTITPDQPQAQPLLLGQPTVFRWKVTPTATATGAVKAEVSADLQSVGKSLTLGSVQSQAGISNIHLSGRLLGVGLLILVLVIVAGWIVSRGSRGPAFRRRDI